MNNFAKTETMPKSGHVTEVCKEWLVREDNALAYKLQSQEINEFYKGNRYRNAVVREDFPTALHEQIKEKENADKQSEAYRKWLHEQEENDQRVAKEISYKLENDLQEQREREFIENEAIAQQMQEIYVNMPPIPPPSRANTKPPPRPTKASINKHSPIDAYASARLNPKSTSTSNHIASLIDTGEDLRLGAAVSCSQPYPLNHNNDFNSNFVVKLSPEKYDELIGNRNSSQQPSAAAAVERDIQQHADDIELYVDPCDYASFKESGLPMDEIKELSKKLKQEQKDELLARRLQQMEANDGVSQEEKDRLLAIEAQDKELAKMLQDREKAKAKRAKEKARLRKNQHKDATSNNSGHTLTSDGMFQHSIDQGQKTYAEHAFDPDVEAYSNPIDVIRNQRTSNGTLTNGSLSRETNINKSNQGDITPTTLRYDDIYTMPIDSCKTDKHHSKSYAQFENIGELSSLSKTGEISNVTYNMDSSSRLIYSKSSSIDKNSASTPPYMPIQGTRRSNSSDDRKKKSKDKCTHQ